MKDYILIPQNKVQQWDAVVLPNSISCIPDYVWVYNNQNITDLLNKFNKSEGEKILDLLTSL